MEKKLYCRCGRVIDEIEYWNSCNDEGEDYHVIIAECDCGDTYERSYWGWSDGLDDWDYSYLADYYSLKYA